MNIILIPIFLPLIMAFLILFISEKTKYIKELTAIVTTLIALMASIAMFGGALEFSLPWAGYGADFKLKTDNLNIVILTASSFFSFLIAVYSFGFMRKKTASTKWFNFNLLITQAFSAGAILSDNLLLLLFFWEGLLIFLYAFIALSNENRNSKATAMKAFIINAATDLCLVLGIAITGYLAGTLNMSEINASGKLTMHGWAIGGYLLLMIAAISKTGAMPFHTWIPDAGKNSNVNFMAYIPAAMDKILGVYFLIRISVYLYQLNGGMQIMLMTIGAATLLFAVMMALVQTDYKKLLSYHAVSQAGYMILGIGTLHPIGIAGGLFHMLNNAIYKSCLFLTAGSVERQTKTTDIRKLGGLIKNMPLTGLFFIIAALSISGVAPFSGFFSKELIYKGTLLTGHKVFFFIAVIGSILTLASFLKLGHAVFFGKRPETLKETQEAPFSMLAPMLALAGLCAAFGFGAKLPVKFFLEPSLTFLSLEHTLPLSGFHFDKLFFISVIAALIALISHILGYKTFSKPSKASDHIHHAPGLKQIYSMAEHKFFDIYEQAMSFTPLLGKCLMAADNFFDFLTDRLPSLVINSLSKISQKFHTGSYPLYMALTIIGFALYMVFVLGGTK